MSLSKTNSSVLRHYSNPPPPPPKKMKVHWDVVVVWDMYLKSVTYLHTIFSKILSFQHACTDLSNIKSDKNLPRILFSIRMSPWMHSMQIIKVKKGVSPPCVMRVPLKLYIYETSLGHLRTSNNIDVAHGVGIKMSFQSARAQYYF